MSPGRRDRLRSVALALVAAAALVVPAGAPPAGAAPAKIAGAGSSYVALAMQQWVADAQVSGLSVNYIGTGSPAGLTGFAQSTIDFAGTEAEYSALGGSTAPRGFQYIPDVAGAVAIMYNAVDKAGRKVDYLHLNRSTVARIFMGDISRWSDPAISADNKGLQLPDEPINVVYRGGQSGTTALFYDFVATIEPDLFARWAAKNQLPTAVRIIQLDSTPKFAPKTYALGNSDQIAQYVASAAGRWSIGYDEFGFAKTYKATTAWIENAAGVAVQPYAQNISAALESAKLRPDLSQELGGVYRSTNPDAYPISAYSYLVTQCAQAADRPTCKGPYTNNGVTETLAKWMRYIACDGQVTMATIGYSPLPPNLSQEMANSIGRLQGKPPEQLTQANCANPRFKGTLGAGASSPADPLVNVPSLAGGAGAGTSGGGTGIPGGGSGTGAASPGAGAQQGGGSATGAPGAGGGGPAGGGSPIGTGPASAAGAAGGPASAEGPGELPALSASGVVQAAAGGSRSWRNGQPVAYDRPTGASTTRGPLVLLCVFICLPLVVSGVRRLR